MLTNKDSKLKNLKFLNKNKSYCVMPFSEIYADNAGRYKLCCHAERIPELEKYNTSTTNPFEFFLSKEMDEIRNKMLSGEKINACQICYDQETHGDSFRTGKYNNKYRIVTEPIEIGLKLRVNGSFCNLSCYMCHPYNSSTKRNEMREVFGTHLVDGFYNNISEYKAVKHDRWKSITDDIINHIHLIKHIHLTGGEPLQLPKHWEMIDKIPDEYAKNIVLAYDTNLTELRYKNHSVFDVIDKFKDVHFGISCDHIIGEKLAWLRYPIDVKKFESNLKEMTSYSRKKINVTPSMLNVDDLLDIRKYYKDNFNVDTTFNNICFHPLPLSVRNHKNKKELIEKYKNLPDFSKVVVELRKEPTDKNNKQMIEYLDKISKNRNFDWRKIWKNGVV